MIKTFIVLLALASAARVSLPHQQLQPNSKWVPGGLELIQSYDWGQCECDPAWLQDGYCDEVCNTASCGWEYGDCAYPFRCDQCDFVRLYTPCSYWLSSTIFDDLEDIEPCCEIDVTSVTFEWSQYIAGIKTEYKTLETTFTKTHLGESQDQFKTKRIDFQAGEYIVGVSGRSGWMLNYLVITTNMDRTFEIGDSESGGAEFTVDIPLGFHVVGFGGGKRDYIDSLWLYIRSHPDNRCDCDSSLLGNKKCDTACNNEQCAWDLGDCEKNPDCDCTMEQLMNELCDPECNTEPCWYDQNACPIDDCQCPLDKLGNGNCDWGELCNNEKCKWDDGDCEDTPGCICDPLWLGNNVCNPDCNNLECEFDHGDCKSEPCGTCSFNAVGPLGSAGQDDQAFDDIMELGACCDIRLIDVTVMLSDSNVVTGISASYVYDYQSEATLVNNIGTKGTPNKITLAPGETITKISAFINASGQFVYLEIITTDNDYSYGNPMLGGAPEVLLLDPNYPVVAFYGSYTTITTGTVQTSNLTSLGVYAVLDTTQGCKCLVDGDFSKLFDDVCDLDCYVEECLFDNDGCVECEHCDVQTIYNDVCDEHCNTAECIYDNGSCEPLPKECLCPLELWSNKVCDLVCNTVECEHDNGNCRPDCECDHDLLGDGVCNEECDTFDCLWDDDDCLISFQCDDCRYHHFLPTGQTQTGETYFHDLIEFSVCCQVEISQIYVSVVNGFIHTISTSYISDGVPVFTATREGSAQGAPDTEQTFVLERGEYVIHMEGHYEEHVTHLKFVTNKGNTFEIGTPVGNQFVFDVHATLDYNLVGFDGSYGEYLNTIGAFYIIVNACDYTECSYDEYRFNETCDYEQCFNEVCGYDWDQCDFPDCPCDLDLLFNGECDLDCNIEACNGFDSGDCAPYPGCQICEHIILGNGECDLRCNTEECKYDGGDCVPNCECLPTMLGDGVCQYEDCYNEACRFDDGDCDLPDCHCDTELIYNGQCDYWCNTEECNYDNDECLPRGCNVCDPNSLGDNHCDPICNIEICEYDGGDCPIDGCQCTADQMLQCNPDCNTLQCEFSDGNCGGGVECTKCKFEKIGTLQVPHSGAFAAFDDFITAEVCCDVVLTQVTVYFYNGLVAGFANSYTLDYGTRQVTALSVDQSGLDPAGEIKQETFQIPQASKIVKVTGYLNDDGITQLDFTLDDGEIHSYGNKQETDAVQVIEASLKYSVLGFLGRVSPGLLVQLKVWVRINPDEGGCECDVSLLNNGVCDYPDCWTLQCNYDGDDCDFPDCDDPLCEVPDMFDGECQIDHCNQEGCNNYDNNECIPDCDCLPSVIGNGKCNVKCNTPECRSDGGDCPIDNCQCPPELIDNGVCDFECDTEECLWDNGECVTTFECPECEFREFDPVGDDSGATVFDDTQEFGLCCQLEITTVEVFYNDKCITGMSTLYTNNGVPFEALMRGQTSENSELLELEAGQTIIGAGVFVEDNITQIKLITNDGYKFVVGSPAGTSIDFEIQSHDGIFEVIAFQGSYDDECLTSFSAWYQLVDACPCNEEQLKGNNHCDGECYNKLCGFDWNECPKDCSCSSNLSLLFNNKCDLECNNASCDFDNGKCPIDGCDKCNEELTNDVCDLECNTVECEFDNGKCLPNCDCKPSVLGNGTCDYSAGCWTPECQDDKGDCDPDPDCHCTVPQLYNNQCDYECNYEACDFDNGACEPYPGCDDCDISLLGNDVCNPKCNTEKCYYDGGDCKYPGCQCDEDLVGNGVCNEDCNNVDCLFDDEECTTDPKPNECDSCKFYRAGPIGGTANGDTFDYLQFSELCCHYFIRALELGGTNLPVPRISTLLIYVEKDSYTSIEIIGFDDTNNVTLNDYDRTDFTDSKQFIADQIANRPSERVFKTFEDDEYIVEISGLASDIINKLTFTTNFKNEVSINFGLGTREMHINLRRYGVVSFFGIRETIKGAFAKLGFWIVRIDVPQDICDTHDLIGDEVCQYEENYNRICEWDDGDCEVPAGCDCSIEEYHNDTCDWHCNTQECDFDNGSCHPAGCTCEPHLFSNGVCDLHCNTEVCNYDPDCPVPGCSECGHELLNNGKCDEDCNVFDCLWDNWDCTDTYECEDCRFESVQYCPDRTMSLGAQAFNDQSIVEVCCQLEFTEVTVSTLNGTIVGLEIDYVNDGVSAGTQSHGDIQGARDTFQLAQGERLINVKGTADNAGIHSLTFITNKDREVQFGSPLGDEFDLALIPAHLSHRKIPNQEYYIVSFFGYATSSGILCIGAHYQVIDVCEYTQEQKYNQVCDPELMSDVCGNDFGQCNECECDASLLLNGECDPECNVAECNYDNEADCEVSGCTACTNDQLTNGVCDLVCNIQSCEHDNGDCIPNCFCDQSLIGNGTCDLSCNNPECGYDGGECIPGCHCWEDLFNNCCTDECNTYECQWDKGECTESFDCHECEYVQRPNIGQPSLFPDAIPFDDMIDLNPCCDISISSLVIYSDMEIVGMEITYQVNGAQEIRKHGKTGNDWISTRIDLEVQEYIKSVGVAGTFAIEAIEIITSLDNQINAGFSSSDFEYLDIPKGFAVSGFRGHLSSAGVVSLGVYIPASSDASCQCGYEQLFNKTCDSECNTEVCNYDNGDCEAQSQFQQT